MRIPTRMLRWSTEDPRETAPQNSSCCQDLIAVVHYRDNASWFSPSPTSATLRILLPWTDPQAAAAAAGSSSDWTLYHLPKKPTIAMNPLINNAANSKNKDFILHCTKRASKYTARIQSRQKNGERDTKRDRDRDPHHELWFSSSAKKQTLAKTTYLLLCYAHTQFLNPGRRDLQELLPTNSELSETIWARAILYWIFIFLQLHSFTTIHDTWSDPPPNNITHHHSTIISHNNNFFPAACLPQLSGRWLSFVECLRILRPKIWTTSATKKFAKFSQYSRLLEK